MRIIDADKLVEAFWKVLYDYEDKTERQFMEYEELNLADWFQHRIFVQTIHGELIKATDDAPPIKTKLVKYYDEGEKVWKIGEVIVDGEREGE